MTPFRPRFLQLIIRKMKYITSINLLLSENYYADVQSRKLKTFTVACDQWLSHCHVKCWGEQEKKAWIFSESISVMWEASCRTLYTCPYVPLPTTSTSSKIPAGSCRRHKPHVESHDTSRLIAFWKEQFDLFSQAWKHNCSTNMRIFFSFSAVSFLGSFYVACNIKICTSTQILKKVGQRCLFLSRLLSQEWRLKSH